MTKSGNGRMPELEPNFASGFVRSKLAWALLGLALVYAFVCGFHTVYDLDLGWHLATGRYIVQHHAVPRTDVLSYTSRGVEWIYPPLADVLFYWICNTFGYSGLTWSCAVALSALVGYLVLAVSATEAVPAAVLAIFAVPILATRMGPRPDLFSQLFFAIFLVELWRFHRSGVASGTEYESETKTRAVQKRLWILPLVMLLWVNIHPGFIAGIGIIFAYLLMEAFEFTFLSRQRSSLLRLRQAWPALLATVFVTLFNPFGYKIYKASLTMAGLTPNHRGSGPAILELQPMTLPASFMQAMDWRSADSDFWRLATVAVLVMGGALYRRQLGAALLMAVALYAPLQHVRYQGMFAISVVVIGSTILTDVALGRRQSAGTWVPPSDALSWLTVIAICILCLLVGVRMTDLISSRAYVVEGSPMLFGSGESWWFPERAATFIQQERLPGNIFQDYNLGGFVAWRLGPGYGDFIDGRNVDTAIWEERQRLISSSPDSQLWENESDQRGINILFFSLGRFSGGSSTDVMRLCASQRWRPVYLDEVSIVLLRNRPENRGWIDRFEVNCSTHRFVPPRYAPPRELSIFYYNSGLPLLSLNRADEAIEALTRARDISPDDPFIHRTLASIYDMQKREGAEQEYQIALSLNKNLGDNYSSLGRFYFFHGRFAEARPLIKTATQLSLFPIDEYILLGYDDLMIHEPQAALLDFSKSEEVIRRSQGEVSIAPEFFVQIAEGRAQAYLATGQQRLAVEAQREAVRRNPEGADHWLALARIYETTGQPELAEQARQQAQALSKK